MRGISLIVLVLIAGLGFAGFDSDELAYLGEVCQSLGVDMKLMLAIAEEESDYNWDAIGGSGEVGAFQIKPSTFKWLRNTVARKYSASNIRSAWSTHFYIADSKIGRYLQIDAAVLFIRWLYDHTDGRMESVLLRYNASYRKEAYAKEVIATYNHLSLSQ